MGVSIIIPAYNEEQYLPRTIESLDKNRFWDEIIIVDDGSKDRTSEIPVPDQVKIIRHERNLGKGSALKTGIEHSKEDLLLFLDADLQETAVFGERLIQPVQQGISDMTIAKFPPLDKHGGFGLVKNTSRLAIGLMTGYYPQEPLSGQRCLHRRIIPHITAFDLGFGIEVAMTLDVVRAGYVITEIEVPFKHRGLGKTLQGFKHRGREMSHIAKTLWYKRNE